VAEVVGVAVPWAHQGRSVFAPQAPPRPRVAYDRKQRRYEFPPGLPFEWRILPPENGRGKNAEHAE